MDMDQRTLRALQKIQEFAVWITGSCAFAQKPTEVFVRKPGRRFLEGPRQELEFWSALGAVLGAVKGLAAPETGRAYERARELWEQLGSPPEFNGIPFGQNRYYTFRGELDLAQRVAEDLLRLSRQRNNSAGLVLGHHACGGSQMLAGRFASSKSHLDEVLALYDPISHRSLVGQSASRPDVISQGYLAIVLFCLGFPDQALAQGDAAVARAKRLDHPPSLAGPCKGVHQCGGLKTATTSTKPSVPNPGSTSGRL